MSNDRQFNLITQLSLNDDAFNNSIKNVKQNVKDLITGVEGATGNIGEMNKALGALKNISFAGKSTEEIAAINDRIKTLKKSIAELSEAQGSIKPPEFHESKLEEHIKRLATMAGAVEAIKLGYEGFKKIMESNETTAEKLEVVMAQVDGATQSLLRTIANGDWSNLLVNMDKAIKASKEYAETMKLLHNEQRGTDILNSEAEQEISDIKIQLVAAKVKGLEGKAEYDKLLARALELRKGEMQRNLDLATETYTTESNKILSRTNNLIIEQNNKNFDVHWGGNEDDLKRLVKFTEESKKNYEAVKKYQELDNSIKKAKDVGANVSEASDFSTINTLGEVQKLQKEQQDLVNKHPLMLGMKLILDNSTMAEIDRVGAAMKKQSDVIKENSDKNYKLIHGGLTEELLGEKADENKQKALEKQKTAYELLNEEISKIEKSILSVLKTGGVVDEAQLEKLRKDKEELKQINDEYDIITNKPMKQMEAKTKVPVVSNLPVIPLNNDLAPLNDYASRSKKIHQGLIDFEKTNANNLQKFKNEKYSENYQKLVDDLNKTKITKEQFDKGVKKLDEEQNKDKLSAMSQTFALGQSMFEQNTIAYKAMAISKATIDTFMAADAALSSAPPPFGAILMAATIAAGLVNVAKISGAFEYGGIVPGSNYSGDNVPIMANSGEMILNGSQQSNLFSMLNKGTGLDGSKEVVFKINGTQLVGVMNNYNKKLSYTS